MHICFLCNEYPPHPHGGVGTVTQTLARSLVARNHRASVVGIYPGRRSGEEVENDCGVQVVRLPHTRLRGAGLLVNSARLKSALYRVHEQDAIDVLEGPEASLALIPAAFPARTAIRMNGGHHFFAVTLGQSPRAWRSWLERRSFARADDLCAVSEFVARTTLDLLGMSSRRIEILPNAVDVAAFQPQGTAVEERGLILFVGTMIEKKGLRQLILAMPRILRAVPYARLEIVGRDTRDRRTGRWFGEQLRELSAPAVADRIAFRGAIEHSGLAAVIARAEVCVYPSHMEALPLAWLEGMAMAKAILASNTGPGPEVIEDGRSGLLCDPHDADAIADRVATLLGDPELRARLGCEARARVIRQFSEASLFERNLRFYERITRAA